MTPQEAADRLVAVLNELGAEGIRLEHTHGALCLSAGRDLEYVHVWPVNVTNTAWEAR